MNHLISTSPEPQTDEKEEEAYLAENLFRGRSAALQVPTNSNYYQSNDNEELVSSNRNLITVNHSAASPPSYDSYHSPTYDMSSRMSLSPTSSSNSAMFFASNAFASSLMSSAPPSPRPDYSDLPENRPRPPLFIHPFNRYNVLPWFNEVIELPLADNNNPDQIIQELGHRYQEALDEHFHLFIRLTERSSLRPPPWLTSLDAYHEFTSRVVSDDYYSILQEFINIGQFAHYQLDQLTQLDQASESDKSFYADLEKCAAETLKVTREWTVKHHLFTELQKHPPIWFWLKPWVVLMRDDMTANIHQSQPSSPSPSISMHSNCLPHNQF